MKIRATKDKKGPLAIKAYQLLKKRIVSLELKPGEKLDIENLEKEMSLGRTPIREALLKLEAENLIESPSNKGSYVKHISFQDVKNLFEALFVIEKFAAKLACRRITSEQLQQMKQINKSINKALDERNFLEITVENSNFHKLLAKASANQYISSILNTLQNEAQRLAYLSYSQETPVNYSLEEHFRLVRQHHANIINFLEKKQTEDLENQIVEHLELFRSRILKYLTSE
jgi:DNA-binding GntR family transcriptional regulator